MMFHRFAVASLLSIYLGPNKVKAQSYSKYTNEDRKGPLKIGETYPIKISNDVHANEVEAIVSTNNGKFEKKWTIKHNSASYMTVKFATMDLDPSCQATTSDCSGHQEYVMKGKGKMDMGENFWGHSVQGECIDITLACNSPNHEATMEISEYAAGYPKAIGTSRNLRGKDKFPFHQRDLSICGADDKRNAKCYESSYSTQYQQGRAVARLLINGSGLCTGWLAGAAGNVLITNEHCIATQADAQNTEFQFMYEDSACNVNDSPTPETIYDGLQLLAVSAPWDYAVIRLDANAGATYGSLQVENRKGNVDEDLFIPQHPGGRAKEFGIEDTTEPGGLCKVLGFRPGCSSEDMSYTCDTEGGSSGSPVLSRETNTVIALHHCGGACNGNLGAPIYRFYNEIENFLAPATPTISPAPTTQSPTSAPTPVPTAITCSAGESHFIFNINTDNYGGETTWTLTNDCDNSSVQTGGPYSSNSNDNVQLCLPSNAEYTFTINDSYGDGICCSFGTGSYYLYWDGQAVKESAQNLNPFSTSSESTTFGGSCSAPVTPPPPTPAPVPPPTASPTTASPTPVPSPAPTATPTTAAPTLFPTTVTPTPAPTPPQCLNQTCKNWKDCCAGTQCLGSGGNKTCQ